jgi:folate-binding protein YgfZ
VADRVEIAVDPRPVTYVANPPAALMPAEPWGLRRHATGLALRWPWTGLDELLWIGADVPGSTSTDAVPIEAERIAAGSPAFGRELDSTTIPIEAALTDWLSAEKGCYVGQEVIERMWSRERIARRLVAWQRDGDGPLPDLPATVRSGPHDGSLTSAAIHPDFGAIALGWLPARAVTAEAFLDAAGGRWRPLDHPPARGRALPIRRLREGT